MEKIFPSVLGYLIGFIVSTLVWGKTEESIGLIPNLRFSLGAKEVFLHHWMLFLVLTIFILLVRNQIPSKMFFFLLGIFIGGLHQGLTYKDWYVLVK